MKAPVDPVVDGEPAVRRPFGYGYGNPTSLSKRYGYGVAKEVQYGIWWGSS